MRQDEHKNGLERWKVDQKGVTGHTGEAFGKRLPHNSDSYPWASSTPGRMKKCNKHLKETYVVFQELKLTSYS